MAVPKTAALPLGDTPAIRSCILDERQDSNALWILLQERNSQKCKFLELWELGSGSAKCKDHVHLYGQVLKQLVSNSPLKNF